MSSTEDSYRAHRVSSRISEKIRGFESEYGDPDQQRSPIYGLAVHPATLRLLCREVSYLVCQSVEAVKLNGYPTVRAYHIPRETVRVIPRGRLTFYREAGVIYAWPDLRPTTASFEDRPIGKTMRFDRGSTLNVEDVEDEEVKNSLRKWLTDLRHTKLGAPDITVWDVKESENVYRIIVAYPFRAPGLGRYHLTHYLSKEQIMDGAARNLTVRIQRHEPDEIPRQLPPR